MTKLNCKETSSKKQEDRFMNKNQIFIKSGTEYKKMTKELLTASNLAELIGESGVAIRSVRGRHHTSGNRSGNPGISERKRISEYDDSGGILGGRPYGGCL